MAREKTDMPVPSYWQHLTEIYDRQTRKGIQTYGQRIEDNDSLSLPEMVTMAEEELVDLCQYMEWIRDKAEKRTEDFAEGYAMAMQDSKSEWTKTGIDSSIMAMYHVIKPFMGFEDWKKAVWNEYDRMVKSGEMQNAKGEYAESEQSIYRWHSLEDDPTNLPVSEEKVLVITQTKNGNRNYVLAYYMPSQGRWASGMCQNVIAWKRIEPMEVE